MAYFNILTDSLESLEEEYLHDVVDTPNEILSEDDDTLNLIKEFSQPDELDEVDRNITLVEDDLESLESITSILGSHIDKGVGLTQQSHVVMSNHLNSISKRLGVSFPRQSVESFDSSNPLWMATDSMEGIKEVVETIKDWLIKHIKQIYRYITEWRHTTFRAYQRFYEQAKKLKTVIVSLETNKQSTELSDYAPFQLSYPGKGFLSPRDYVKFLSVDPLSGAASIPRQVQLQYAKNYELIRGLDQEGIDSKDMVDIFSTSLKDALSGFMNNGLSIHPDNSGFSLTILGGVISLKVTPLGRVSVELVDADPGGGTLPTLNKDDLIAICDAIIRGVRTTADRKTTNTHKDKRFKVDHDFNVGNLKQITRDVKNDKTVSDYVRKTYKDYMMVTRAGVKLERSIIRLHGMSIRHAIKWLTLVTQQLRSN